MPLLALSSSDAGFRDVLLTFLGDPLPTGTTGWGEGLEIVLRFASAIASTIFLGAIVSKFFLGARVGWRSGVSVTTQGGVPVFEVRFRNRGHLPLHEVEARAYIRVRRIDRGARTAINSKAEVLVAGKPAECQQWPTMSGGMPLTLRLPMSDEVWAALRKNNVSGRLGSIGNVDIASTDPGSVSLVVSVSGQASVTGLSISEARTYPILSETGDVMVEHGRPASIDYEPRHEGLWQWYPIRSFRFNGAQHFDELDALVFVYGSLMNLDSLMETVRRSVLPGFETVEIIGWRRCQWPRRSFQPALTSAFAG